MSYSETHGLFDGIIKKYKETFSDNFDYLVGKIKVGNNWK